MDRLDHFAPTGGERMLLTLKNIGKLTAAEIYLNGITVITGENDSGKSTVGKALFSFINSLYRVEEKILEERERSVLGSLFGALMNKGGSTDLDTGTNSLTRDIIKDRSRYLDHDGDLYKVAKEIIQQQIGNHDLLKDEQAISRAVEQIKESLEITDDDILGLILQRYLDKEFHGQICSFDVNDTSELILQAGNRQVSATLKNDRVEHIANTDGISLWTDAIYIDDPFVLDGIIRTAFFKENSPYSGHRLELVGKILSEDNVSNQVDYIVREKNLARTWSLLARVCDGTISREFTRLVYRPKGSTNTFKVDNLSTGLKTFVVLKILLENGSIRQYGTLILDEPEIHLHPEWQLVLAELVVLLHKDLGINILLNTHSPYFLRAIQVYSAKHLTADRCSYYFAEVKEARAVVRDVSNSIDEIYAKLAAPLQQLENERWTDAEAE